MATVVKNFRIKSGLVVEGSTGTINGQNILTETGGDTYILNLVGGATLVKSVSADFAVDGSGNLTINGSSDLARTGDITTAVNNLDTDDIEEGGSNLYFTNQRALDATSSAYDAYGAASTAQSNAEDYADGLASNYDAAGAAATAQSNAEDYADGLASNYDPAGSASTAETNANSYTDTALGSYTTTANLDTTIDGYGYLKSADLSGYATEAFVGTAIDNLVDGAPGLLDTLNEIAAAINDDENYATTITTALSGKQATLTASTGITIDGSNNISVTSNTYDAYGAAATAQSNAEDYADGLASNYDPAGAAATAQSNAEDYADGLASNYDAAGTAAGLVDDLKDGTTPFTEINVNSQAKQIAAEASSLGSVVVTAYQWPKSDYRSGKFLVKIDNQTDNEMSEILVTLDSSDNIAITEYAIVGTNGSRGTITADVSGSNVRIRVNPVNDSVIKISGTLLI